MELILSAISAGGLVGAANQYACLLILAIAARLNIITLSPQMTFVSSYWFIAIVGVFWLLTIAPSFSALFSPGVSNAVNAITNFISGFLVPVSSAMLSLAAIGVIVNLNPELEHVFETLKFLTKNDQLGTTSILVASASAASATVLTGIKAISKPAISATTATAGSVSAPMFTLFENLAAVVLMVMGYFLAKINPWLLVLFFVLIILGLLALLVYSIYQLKKIGKGIGRVLILAQVNPRAGLSIVVEFLIWGLGWLVLKQWGRGAIMMFLWSLWLIAVLLFQPLFVALFAFLPPLLLLVGVITLVFLILLFVVIGFRSAKALLLYLESDYQQEDIQNQS